MTVQTDDVVSRYLVVASEIRWVWSVEESLFILLESRIPAKKLSGSETIKYPGLSGLIILVVVTVRIIPSLLCRCPGNSRTEFRSVLRFIGQILVRVLFNNIPTMFVGDSQDLISLT